MQCQTEKKNMKTHVMSFYIKLKNQINVRALIGQSAVGYCASKPMENSRVLWIVM